MGADSNGGPTKGKGAVGKRVAGLISFLTRQLDRVVSPNTRQTAYNAVYNFAQERPLLASFVFTQLLFSLIPILVFLAFILSTAAFAFGLALVFTLFWAGVALLVLVPTIFLTSSVAVIAYVWALSSYLLARQVYSWVPKGEGQAGGDSYQSIRTGQAGVSVGNGGVAKFESGIENPGYGTVKIGNEL